jgi:transposase IS66-like protein
MRLAKRSARGSHLPLIATAKLNDVDPQAWLADVLARLPDHPGIGVNR